MSKKKKKEVERLPMKYKIWQHYLYSGILVGIPLLLFCLFTWRIEWIIFKIWIIAVLIIGTSAVVQDYYGKGWNNKKWAN